MTWKVHISRTENVHPYARAVFNVICLSGVKGQFVTHAVEKLGPYWSHVRLGVHLYGPRFGGGRRLLLGQG